MGRRRYTEHQFRDAVADPSVTTIAELCRRLGIRAGGGNDEVLRAYAQRLGVQSRLFSGGKASRPVHALVDLSDADAVGRVLGDAHSLAEAIRRLGGDVTAHNYRRLHAHIAAHGLDTTAMTGKGWAAGRRFPASRVPVAALLGRTRVNSTRLREKLIEEGYKDERCEQCRHTTWQGRPIPLELDHVDGDRTNNHLGNLRLLCPNCHALTPTYRGRNIGRSADPG